jgi:hypothetical protein
MTLEEFISKLELIEQQARLTIMDPGHPHVVEHQRLIAGLARQLIVRLHDQLRGGDREAFDGAVRGGAEADADGPPMRPSRRLSPE